MKRLAIIGLSLGAALLVVGAAAPSIAKAENQPLSPAHLERIRTHCVEAKSSLNQLHASDGLLRVNRGQLYELISTKLMAPLNSRLVLYRISSDGLVALGSDYDKQLETFRAEYQQYEVAMSQTLGIDCVKQPQQFYESLADAREKRQKTHAATVALQETIENYGTTFDSFSQKFKADSK